MAKKEYLKDKQVRIDLETYKTIENYAKEKGYTIKEAIKQIVNKQK